MFDNSRDSVYHNIMVIYIDHAREICENAFKITVIVLFINFYVLVENCLQNLCFNSIKNVFYTLHFMGATNCLLYYTIYRCYRVFFILSIL
jgi:hypothetical protein